MRQSATGSSPLPPGSNKIDYMERQYTISTGTSRYDTNWQSETVTWPGFLNRLTSEELVEEKPYTHDQYMALPKKKRDSVKDIGGFMGGALIGGRRLSEAVQYRSMLTCDLDDLESISAYDVMDTIKAQLPDISYCIYSTLKSTDELPRLRLIIPFSRDVTKDEYEAVARAVVQKLGLLEAIDPSSYRVTQLMYWPAVLRGETAIQDGCDGDPLQVDAVLEGYPDWHNIEYWPRAQKEATIIRKTTTSGSTLSDPRSIAGMPGLFNRTYTVSSAIATFLPDVYRQERNGRYTYIAGSSTNGLMVDNDLRAYSNHATDPAYGHSYTAYDLVRVHKFGKLDIAAAPDTPVNRLPSSTKMNELVLKDARCLATKAAEDAKEAEDAFNAIENGDYQEAKTPAATPVTTVAAPGAQSDWLALLERDSRGKIKNTQKNITIAIASDPRLKGLIVYDAFKDCIVKTKAMPWEKESEYHDPEWSDSDDSSLVVYLAVTYGLEGKAKIIDAITHIAHQNVAHGPRQYFKALPEWDKTERVDLLTHQFLGAPDTQLNRCFIRKTLCAAYYRMTDTSGNGVKFDQLTVLTGLQGIGKSTFWFKLSIQDNWFADQLPDISNKDIFLKCRGHIFCEVGEMTNYAKASPADYKAWLSSKVDEYRAPYDRINKSHPRQYVLVGSGNVDRFLRGDDGNRRFWVISCAQNKEEKAAIEKSVFTEMTPDFIAQVWAEVKYRCEVEHEPLTLTREMAEEADRMQEQKNEVNEDPMRGMIQAFIVRLIPADWDKYTPQEKQRYIKTGYGRYSDTAITLTRRTTICAQEVVSELYDAKLGDKTALFSSQRVNAILSTIPGLTLLNDGERVNVPGYGRQRKVFAIDYDRIDVEVPSLGATPLPAYLSRPDDDFDNDDDDKELF